MLTVYFRVRLLFGDVAVHVTCGGKTTQFANFSTAFSDLFEKKTLATIEQKDERKKKVPRKVCLLKKTRLLKLTHYLSFIQGLFDICKLNSM